jgi:hypothetical protein
MARTPEARQHRHGSPTRACARCHESGDHSRHLSSAATAPCVDL